MIQALRHDVNRIVARAVQHEYPTFRRKELEIIRKGNAHEERGEQEEYATQRAACEDLHDDLCDRIARRVAEETLGIVRADAPGLMPIITEAISAETNANLKK